MPIQISTSLTTAETRANMYPPDAEYLIDAAGDGADILYTLHLVPREPR